MGKYSDHLQKRQAATKVANKDVQEKNAEAKVGGERKKDILQRVEDLEKAYISTITALNKVLERFDREIKEAREIAESASDVLGPDSVKKRMQERHDDRTRQKVEAEQAAVQKAIAAGAMKELSTVVDDCVIVGLEKDKDGNLVGSGHDLSFFSDLIPEIKTALLGKAKGDVVPTPGGGTVELLGVYQVVPPEERPAPSDADLNNALAEVEKDIQADLDESNQ